MEKYAKIMAILAATRKVYSRIKLQKMVYVMKSLGYPLSEGYEYKDYGPYSDDLASELRSLTNADYVHEEHVTAGGDDTEGEDPSYERYDLSIAPRGEGFFRSFVEKSPQITSLVEQLGKVAQELNRYSPRDLELIATIMFLQDLGVLPDRITRQIQSLKPQFSAAEIGKAVSVIASIRTALAHRSGS